MARMALPLALGALLVAAVAPSQAAAPVQRSLLVVGDSLALFAQPYVKRELPLWSVRERVQAARRAAEATKLLRAYGRHRLPPVIHVSLGTIDEPQRTGEFRAAVRGVMRLAGPRRCVVWANVYRPAREGTGYDGFNRILAEEDAARDNLRVVDWEAMVEQNRGWLLGDAVHVTADGYRARARAIAAEVRGCRAWLARARRGVLVNGDSLAFDSLPFLTRELRGRRVIGDIRFARRAGQGAAVLRRYGRRLPAVIHVSLGTADDPGRPGAFRRAVRRLMRAAGPGRCVVWANVWRPVEAGPGFEDLNAVLAGGARRRDNLRVVDWAAMVAANPHWLDSDSIHVDDAGNHARARAVARAIRACDA